MTQGLYLNARTDPRPMPSLEDTDKTVIRAGDPLYGYLEFQSLTPDRLEWNASALAGNPPRLI
jgi:hypothetical protein